MILKFTRFDKEETPIVCVFDNIESIEYKYKTMTRKEVDNMCDGSRIRPKHVFFDRRTDKGSPNRSEEKRYTYIWVTGDNSKTGISHVFFSESDVFCCNDNGDTVERYSISSWRGNLDLIKKGKSKSK